MNRRFVVDMNLSPDWVAVLAAAGWGATHWSAVGDPRAKDRAIVDWCRDNDWMVFTHDLDFGALLALTHADGPSVLLLRAEDVLPGRTAAHVIDALADHGSALERGALVVVDETRSRVRVLPF